jgi:hypothetical protein
MPERRGESFLMEDAAQAGPASFSALILGLASAARIHLGQIAHPDSGTVGVNLELARQTIAMLEMLEQKTRGNLSGDEGHALKSLLTDLKLRFVAQSEK